MGASLRQNCTGCCCACINCMECQLWRQAMNKCPFLYVEKKRSQLINAQTEYLLSLSDQERKQYEQVRGNKTIWRFENGMGVIVKVFDYIYEGSINAELQAHSQDPEPADKNRIIYWNQDIYEGQMANDLPEGRGRFRGKYRKQADIYSLQFKGQWVSGQPSQGTLLNISTHQMQYQILSLAEPEEDNLRRRAQIILPGEMVYKGQLYVDKKRHIWCIDGSGTMEFRDGSIYEGQWSNGEMHGKGTYTWPWLEQDGDAQPFRAMYDGHFSLGLKHGEGTYYYYNGTEKEYYEGFWQKGQLYFPQNLTNNTLHSSDS